MIERTQKSLTMSDNSTSVKFDKLKGSENYHSWKFSMVRLLQTLDLDGAVDGSEKDAKKCKKACARIGLQVEDQIQPHIQNAKTAKEVWDTLAKLYEEKGLSRQCGLVRKIATMSLEDCDNMQHYINEIMSCATKLRNIGFPVEEKYLATFMLAGLPEKYMPLIMTIETGTEELTGDLVMSKLLECRVNGENSENSAFFGKGKKFAKKNPNDKKKIFKCFNCDKPGHKASECTKPKREKNSQKSGNNANDNRNKKAAFVSVFEEEQCNLSASQNEKECADEWYIDSGASSHMTPHRELLTLNVRDGIRGNIITANNAKLNVALVGNAEVMTSDTMIEISNVLYVPKLSANLLSVSRLVEKGNRVVFEKSGCTIYDPEGKVVDKCKSENGIYKLKTDDFKCLSASQSESDIMKWHRRLGHMNYESIMKMTNLVDGINVVRDKQVQDEILKCEVCSKGKQSKAPFKASTTETSQILELIHSDVMGPFKTQSIGKAKYLLTFIDDYSRKVFTYGLSKKSDVLEKFKEFKTFIEKYMDAKIKILRSDNGGEYGSADFATFMRKEGIKHQKTIPHTPEQNGVAERMNRTLLERAKCLMFDANLPPCFWGEAFNMATYLINRSVTSSHGGIPNEKFFNEKVKLNDLKQFGTEVMVQIPKSKRGKMDENSEKLIFVGYDQNTKGFRCIDRKTRKFTLARNVKFLDEPKHEINEIVLDSEDGDGDKDQDDSIIEIDESIFDENADDTIYNDTTAEVDQSNYVPHRAVVEPVTPTNVVTRSKGDGKIGFMHGNLAVLCDENFVFKCDEALQCDDPIDFKDLAERNDAEKWKAAMKEEMNSLLENKTWELKNLPAGKKAIKTRWIYKTKRDHNGNVVKLKARLVAKGFTQRYGVDYEETFAPVVRYGSIRYLIALAAQTNLKIHQMDVVTAFLQGDLDEEIYMEQPSGYDDGSGRYCLLKRSIYGLKQAGRQWNMKLDKTLKDLGYSRCKTDPCIYMAKKSEVVIAIYVDDFLIFYKNEDELEELKALLSQKFKMKDMGTAKGCIGIRINQKGSSIEIDQSIYVGEILKRFGMDTANPIKNPNGTSLKLTKTMESDDTEDLENIPYQQAIGCLIFLMQGTRPDIAFAVNNASRYNNCFNSSHWKAVKRILRYLKLTQNNKLVFSKQPEKIMAFVDADWASNEDTRKSCTGFIFMYGGAAVLWKSGRQPIVALSSTEAEYIALGAAVQEAMWIRQLAMEVTKMTPKIAIHVDNQSAIKLALSEGYRPRTKHIDVKHHFLREHILSSAVEIKYVSTTENTADFLTKAVPLAKFIYCSNTAGIRTDLN